MTNDTPRIAILDCSTGITTEREMNAEELADLEVRSIQAAEMRETEEAEKERVATLKKSAKAKLISGQPLTEEEASVLVI
jgi:hypothetical protein